MKKFRGEVLPERIASVYVEIFNRELGLEKINSISDIFKNKTPHLSQLVKSTNENSVLAMIELFIISINKFLDLPKTMNEESIRETAKMILNKYGSLTIADVRFVFNQAKFGHYGTLKYAITGMDILYWFDRHFDERCNTAFNESYSSHLELTEDCFHRSMGKENTVRKLFQDSKKEKKSIKK